MEFGSDQIFIPKNQDALLEVVEEDDLNLDLAEFGDEDHDDVSNEEETLSETLSLEGASSALPPAPVPSNPIQTTNRPPLPTTGSARGGVFGRMANAFGLNSAPQQQAAPRRQAKRQPRTSTATMGRRAYRREVDTNVIKIDLGKLGGEVTMATGDPKFCSRCNASLNSESLLNSVEGEDFKMKWDCEFCGEQNILDMVIEEKPSAQSVDYILENAVVAAMAQENQQAGGGLVIFVIDTSGSMCISQEIEGELKLKGDHTESLRGLRGYGDDWNQRLPNENTGVTYVSRMQALQAAVDAQIEELVKENPQIRVGLITFNHEVTIFGDGSKAPVTIAGDRLEKKDEILEISSTYTVDSPLSDSKEMLKEKLFGIEETGATALGPAVVTALGMAQNHRGAKIIICTDGLANIGLGSVDELKTTEDRMAANAFYSSLGEFAASNGLMIDVVGIQGDHCDLGNIGAMAEATNGEVTLVDIANLTSNFSGIMQNPLVATEVSLKMLLHRGLMFRNEPEATLGDNGSSVEKAVGNAAEDTCISFEFKPRPDAQDPNCRMTKLPFQVQIRYTRLNGDKCIRVLSQSREVTDSREQAEKAMHINVIGSHVQLESHKMAKESKYYRTRTNMRAWGKMMARNRHTELQEMDYATTLNTLRPLDQELERSEEAEIEQGNMYFLDNADSDSDDDERRYARSSARAVFTDTRAHALDSMKHGGRNYSKNR